MRSLLNHLNILILCVFGTLVGFVAIPASISYAHAIVNPNIEQHPVPPNFVTRRDKQAERLIPEWVKYMNLRNYDAAADLWVPDEREFLKTNPVAQHYNKNIERLTLLQYKDVTSTWGGIPMDLSRFSAIKVYISIIDYKVYQWQTANVMLGKKMQRCFVVKQTPSSPWRIYMMQGYSPFSAQESWGLDLSGVTGYGSQYHPDYKNLNASQTALYQDFIKQCIGPAVQKAVDDYYRYPRRVAYPETDILKINRLSEGSYWFEITVRVRSSKGSFNPPYGVETITLTNKTKDAGYQVKSYVHQDEQ